MMNDEPIILSEEGQRRQREILQAALGAARYRKRRNIVIDAARFCTVVVGMGLIVWAVVYSRKSTLTGAGGIVKHEPRAMPTPAVTQDVPVIVVKRIETDPNILERLMLKPITSTVRHIGDDELLRELADAHQSAGLITVDGKSRLIFR